MNSCTSKQKIRNKPKKNKLTEEEKREKIRTALLKKKSYEDKALKIVEQMIEPGLAPKWLLESALYLNKSYYSDGVEERALTRLCGYPLCDKTREEKKKQGRYHISLRDKKVYDLEERKLFCSNHCFKASNFFLDQLETSPLWLRELEQHKEFHLYDGVGTVCNGGGRVMDIALLDTVKMNQVNKVQEQPNEHETDEADNEDEDIGHIAFEQLMLEDKPDNGKVVRFNCNTKQNEMKLTEQEANDSDIVLLHNSAPNKLKKGSKENNREPPIVIVGSAIHDWFTIDTFRFIFGDDELRTRLEEHNVDGGVLAAALGDKDLEEQYQARYRDICRKLDMLENLEKSEVAEKAPLPSFEMVKEHCEVENLKMSSYMAGKEIYEQEVLPKGSIRESDSATIEARLPLLDHTAQQSHRKRIVLDKLFKTLPELTKLLSFSLEDLKGNLRGLVNSFQFSADNVVFRPDEWTLIGIFLLKLLSLKMSDLHKALSDKNAVKYIKLILLSHQLDIVVLDQMMRDLTSDVIKLVAKYNIQY